MKQRKRYIPEKSKMTISELNLNGKIGELIEDIRNTFEASKIPEPIGTLTTYIDATHLFKSSPHEEMDNISPSYLWVYVDSELKKSFGLNINLTEDLEVKYPSKYVIFSKDDIKHKHKINSEKEFIIILNEFLQNLGIRK